MNHLDGYGVKPKFYVINFDAPRRSHRCNPIHPDFMEDITDTCKSAYTIMLNLNRTWVQNKVKQIVADELLRIQNDPALAHLLEK